MAVKNRLTLLFSKYLDGSSSPEETYEFMALAAKPNHEQALKSLMDQELARCSVSQGMDELQQQLVLQYIFSEQGAAKRRFPLWKKILSSAAVLCILYVSVTLYLQNRCTGNCTEIAYTGKLVPASSKAILTLSDGKKISLGAAASGRLASEHGLGISKQGSGRVVYTRLRAAGQPAAALYNTVSTPAGGTYQLVLPDGTRVWLNASSSLRFGLGMGAAASRNVTLSGEAYFEVAKRRDARLQRVPFVVSSARQEVEVLGTHFNISAYPESAYTLTTLSEGSVNVRRAGVFSSVLRPGQQARTGASITISEVDTSLAMAWKNGLFKFENAPINTVMDQFSKWYDIDVVYEAALPGTTFNGEIYRDMDATRALQLLGLSRHNYHVVRKGGRKKIIITNK